MDFSSIVKTSRKKLNMSQKELARAINVSFATINRWENGKTNPTNLSKSVFYDFCEKSDILVGKNQV